jgi:plasmid stabilization system protein ParE
MRVRYTPRARADLKEIDAYLRTKSLQGARNVRERIREAAGHLGEMPGTGRESVEI